MPASWQKILEALEIPPETAGDVPKITIVAGLRISVEQHQGLLAYHPEKIVLRMGKGQLVLEGRDLVIGSLSQQAITVLGEFRRLSVETD
ncbi:MAG: YabP/YqfC family sporulation protein [Bacillota bacterium]|nr:YabP/YqfC family sporulation protein [Bacillota bacterium]